MNAAALTQSIALKEKTKELAQLLSNGYRDEEAYAVLLTIDRAVMKLRQTMKDEFEVQHAVRVVLRGQRNST